jgi:hypothetical protein
MPTLLWLFSYRAAAPAASAARERPETLAKSHATREADSRHVSCYRRTSDRRIARWSALKEAAMEPDVLVHRIRAEFMEMPGLRLTLAQATRLWRLEPAVCQEVIDLLVDSHFLRWTASGMVTRADPT